MRILFVCRGNICRSPTAHGVMRALLRRRGWHGRIQLDSAGLRDWHAGEAPDPRTVAHARLRGYELADLRARAIEPRDYAIADLLVAMDDENAAELLAQAPAAHRHKVQRLVRWCRRYAVPDVADPYEGGPQAFEHVLDVVEDACEGLAAWIAAQGGCRRA